MLARSQRITNAFEIARVKQKGKTIHGRFLNIVVLQKHGLNMRFAFVISSHVSKKAVVRNKLKRIMSQFLQENRKQMKGSVDILVIAKQSAVGQPSMLITKDLQLTLKRGLII